MYLNGGEVWVVWLVGAEWFESFFIYDYVWDIFGDCFFFREDFLLLYFFEFGGEGSNVFWEEYVILYAVFVDEEGAEPFGDEMHRSYRGVVGGF